MAKAAIAAITALLIFSCDFGSKLDGSGNVTKQNRPIKEEFKSIAANKGIDVIIEQGPTRTVMVEADDNFHAHIKVEVKGGTLEISTDEGLAGSGTKRVYVTLPELENIEAESGASVTTKSTLRGDSFEFSSSSANIDVNIEAQDLALEASSGGKIRVNGKADNLQTEASSGSTIDAKGLTAKSVTAESSGGGSNYVNPVESLNADASTGGHILYKNTPGKLDKKTSSGGNVKQD